MSDSRAHIVNPTKDTFDGEWTATPLTVVICSALAGYNAIECLILVLSTFKHYKGLYFWSLIVAATGILPYMPGVVSWYFELIPKWAALLLIYSGWYAMVTGQSVVLYSRLGVVLGQEHKKIRKAVKWMIIVDALIFHISTTVISACSVYAPHPAAAGRAYFYMEKLQMTAFSTQELIISSIYIWKTLSILHAGVHEHAQRIITELLTINLIIVLIDVGLLALEYKNLFIHELAFKMVAYSVKAKLEFAILSKLVEISSHPSMPRPLGNNLRSLSVSVSTDKAPTVTLMSSSQAISVSSEKPGVIVTEENVSSTRHRAEFNSVSDITQGF